MSEIAPLETLFDSSAGCDLPLPPRLATLYGSLRMPAHSQRAHVAGNFVSTMDGVVSLGVPGNAGGKAISGDNPHDRMVMGLLRAAADAVIVGAGTFRASSGRRWTAERAYSPLAGEYQAFRRGLGKPSHPLNVIVTASGALDLTLFPDSDISYLIVTTSAGLETLRAQPRQSSVEIVDAGEGPLRAKHIADIVTQARPGNLLLVEAGPHLMADFIAERCLDELFLTIAPQIAGRDASTYRPGLVSGTQFAPNDSRWARLESARRAGSHLFLRYAFPEAA